MLALFFWNAVYLILRDLFHSPTTSAENVLGAIFGYLIAGDAWGAPQCDRVPAHALVLQNRPRRHRASP